MTAAELAADEEDRAAEVNPPCLSLNLILCSGRRQQRLHVHVRFYSWPFDSCRAIRSCSATTRSHPLTDAHNAAGCAGNHGGVL